MNEIKRSDIEGSSPKKSGKHSRRKILLIILVSLGVVAAISAAAFYWSQEQSQSKSSQVCSSTENGEVLKGASGLLSGSKQEELKQLVDKVRSLPNYDEDANCLATVTVYYINEYNINEANNYMAKLSAVYNKDQALDQVFAENALSFDQLKQKLQLYRELSENAKKNTIYMGEDGADAVQQ